jgi:branched-chain amino acid transport system permease protein
VIPRPRLWLAALYVAGALLIPFVLSSYTLTLMGYVGMAALIALGLVILTGVGGLTSFGQAAFAGMGAYASAVLTTRFGFDPWLGLLAALLASGGLALLLGAATLRLPGHLLPLSTIAWGLAIFYLFGDLDLTGGHNGITNIPAPALFGHAIAGPRATFWLIAAFLGVALALSANLLAGRAGRAIRALRGGTAMAESLGIAPQPLRLAVFVLAGLYAGASGWLLAHTQRFVSPPAFDVGPGIEYLFMAMLGGAGQIWGALLGAFVVVVARDSLQDWLGFFVSNSGQAEIVVFGAMFIALLQLAPGGLIPAAARLLPRRRKPAPPPTDAAALPRRAMPPRGTIVLEAHHLIRRFGGLVAVNDVGFTLASGEILGLIGPNGAGKSTLFNLLTGTLPPSAGRVRFLGHETAGSPAPAIARLGMARTFQHVKLRPRMSVLENVMLGAYLRTRGGVLAGMFGLGRADERRAAAEAMRALARVGLAAMAGDQAGSLALGQQRLLEVARALAADPVLLVLDEPAAGLRAGEKAELAALLASLRDDGVAILLVEHDMGFVMGLVDRLVVMDFGTRIAEGAPEAVRADARVQEAYLGGVA